MALRYVLLSMVLLAPLVAALPGAEAQRPLTSEPMRATYTPHVTVYSADARGGVAPLTFEWDDGGACGEFTVGTNALRWEHSEANGCGHRVSHGGTIRVIVRDAAGTRVFCSYDGSPELNGTGTPCRSLEPEPASTPPTPPANSTRGTAPRVEIVSPEDGTPFGEGTPWDIVFETEDAEHDIERVTVEVRDAETGKVAGEIQELPPNATNAVVVEKLTIGTFTVSVTATDREGNHGNDTAQVHVGGGSAPPFYSTTIDGCPAAYEGRMQPSQGAWQDDQHFEDREGMQIRRPDPVTYIAELPMATERRTQIFGVRQAVGEEDQTELSRDDVYLRGWTSGTVMTPVFLRFSLEEDGQSRKVWDSPAKWPVGLGPCGPKASFAARLDATHGALPFSFKLVRPGDYTLRAELYRADDFTPTGIEMTLTGKAVATRAFRVLFQPVVTLPDHNTTSWIDMLEAETERYATEFRATGSDYLPAPTGPWPVVRGDVMDISGKLSNVTRDDPRWARFLRAAAAAVESSSFTALTEAIADEVQRAFVEDTAGFAGLGLGAERTMVILPDRGFFVADPSNNATIAAFAPSSKVQFTRMNMSPLVMPHEFVHSLPEYLWTTDEMVAGCGDDFHNTGENNAAGGRVTVRGVDDPAILDAQGGLMSNIGERTWIEQCTYAHLLRALAAPIDPPVLLVRGATFIEGDATAGVLFAPYPMDGFVDIPENATGEWSVVLLRRDGAELSRHRFDPPTVTSEGAPMRVAALFTRVPRPEGLARVELWGPDGKLDEIDLAAEPPRLTVSTIGTPTTPGPYLLSWNTTPNALVSVQSSVDGGATWETHAFETTARSYEVSLAEGETRVRILATAGGLPREEVRTFSIGAPTTTPSDLQGAPLPFGIALLGLGGALLLRKRR